MRTFLFLVLLAYTFGAYAQCTAVPFDLASSDVGSTSATVCWSDTATATQQVRVYSRIKGTTSWKVLGVSVPLNCANLGNLLANTDYEWRVRAYCGGNFASAVSATHAFKTLALAARTSNPKADKAEAVIEANANNPEAAKEAQVKFDAMQPQVAVEQSANPFWDIVLNNWGKLLFGLLVFLDVVFRITPSERDNTILGFIMRIFDAIVPNNIVKKS